MKLGPLTLKAALLAAVGGLAAPAEAIVFVDENFDSYADTAAMEANWVPRSGDGFSAAPGPGGTFVPSASGVAGQTGGAVTGPAGLVNEHVGGFDPVINTGGYLVQPNATENIVFRGDIFADAVFAATMRQSIGLRSDRFDRNPDPAVTDFGVNIVELGFWNSAGECIPTDVDGLCSAGSPGDPGNGIPPTPADPEFRPETDFAFRVILFDSSSLGDYIENGVNRGQMVRNPNWQFFPLNPLLDAVENVKPNGTAGNGDGAPTLADIGTGWHTFEASIGETLTTLTLDLFRDGIDNATGLPGVDSTVEIEISMAENFNNPPFKFDPAPMNSLRFGAPSGVTSASGLAHFDNLYLALEEPTVDPPTLPGDANNDGKVDLLDLDILGANFGLTTGATVAQGDFNNDAAVNLLDLDILGANFGAMLMPAVAVPEPASLAGVVVLGLVSLARRRG